MMKQLSLAAALALAVACKTDPPAQTGDPAPAATAPSTARSAKIAVKPVLPAAPPSAEDRPQLPERHTRRERMDANGDGVVSDEERAAAMRERVTEMRKRLDLDGDGKLTVAELAAARGRMHFDDPAAVDTNHDGDISADELAAAFQARREQWRTARNGSGGVVVPPNVGSSTDPAPQQ